MTLPENQVLPEEQMVYIDRYKQMDEEAKAKAKEKETAPTPEKKGFIENKRLIAIMSGIALLVVIGGYTANKIFNKNQPVATEIETPTTPVDTPQVVIEAVPAVEKSADTVAETIPTVESLEIDASLMSNPEELIKELMEDRFVQWYNAGNTQENVDVAYASHDEIADSAAKMANEYDENYISALLVPDWQSKAPLIEFVEKGIIELRTVLSLFLLTSSGVVSEDKKPYERGYVVDEITSSNFDKSKKTMTITIIGHSYDNEADNRAGEDLSENIDTRQMNPTLEITEINGKAKISNIIFGKVVK